MVERCNHLLQDTCKDLEVPAAIEAGAKSFYSTSINSTPDSWKWLSPHVRNRWRWRFQQALIAYQGAST